MTRTMPRRDFFKSQPLVATRADHPNGGSGAERRRLGYEPVNTVINAGQFARRGGILDIWPPAEQQPTRLEFFGDEIETLRSFDPASQRTLKTQTRLFVTPAREYLLPEGKLDEANSGGTTEFSEFNLPELHPIPASLLEYLPRQTIIAIDNFQAFEDSITELEEQAVELRRNAIQEGTITEEFPLPYLTWTEIADTLPRRQTIELGPSVYTDQPQAEIQWASQDASLLDALWRTAEALHGIPGGAPLGWRPGGHRLAPVHPFDRFMERAIFPADRFRY